MLAPLSVQSQISDASLTKGYIATQAMADTIIVKGVAFCEYTAQDGSVATDTLIGAIVRNINTQKATQTNIDGEFEIDACMGDSIEVSYVGFNNQIIVVNNREPLRITLNNKGVSLLGEVAVIRNHRNTLDLIIIDENDELFSSEDVTIKLVLKDDWMKIIGQIFILHQFMTIKNIDLLLLEFIGTKNAAYMTMASH